MHTNMIKELLDVTFPNNRTTTYYVDYIYMRFVVEAHTIILNTPAAPAHAPATLPIHMIGLFSLDYSKYVHTFRYALPL
jgi:hypothetical protein